MVGREINKIFYVEMFSLQMLKAESTKLRLMYQVLLCGLFEIILSLLFTLL